MRNLNTNIGRSINRELNLKSENAQDKIHLVGTIPILQGCEIIDFNDMPYIFIKKGRLLGFYFWGISNDDESLQFVIFTIQRTNTFNHFYLPMEDRFPQPHMASTKHQYIDFPVPFDMDKGDIISIEQDGHNKIGGNAFIYYTE